MANDPNTSENQSLEPPAGNDIRPTPWHVVSDTHYTVQQTQRATAAPTGVKSWAAARLLKVESICMAALQQTAAMDKSRASHAKPLRVSRTNKRDGIASRISCSFLFKR